MTTTLTTRFALVCLLHLTPIVHADEWVPLLDAERFPNWRVCNFGGDGKVSYEDGQLAIGMGASLSGIRYAEKLPIPRVGYELKWAARRVEGSDFFCGLTFPYKEGHATLVLGGWGGALVGVSCVDGRDASDNESASYQQFKRGEWYDFRLRVRDGFIDAWIDDARVVSIAVRDRDITVRSDADASRPLGLTTFQTAGQVKNLQYRLMATNQSKAAEASKGN